MLGFVAVGGLAVMVCRAHIHEADMFARSGAIRGHSTGPAFTIARGGAVSVFQGLVFDVRVGVGGEAPNSGDLFGHIGRVKWFCSSWRLVCRGSSAAFEKWMVDSIARRWAGAEDA